MSWIHTSQQQSVGCKLSSTEKIITLSCCSIFSEIIRYCLIVFDSFEKWYFQLLSLLCFVVLQCCTYMLWSSENKQGSHRHQISPLLHLPTWWVTYSICHYHIPLLIDEDWATDVGNVHQKFGEISTSGFWVCLQTDRQTQKCWCLYKHQHFCVCLSDEVVAYIDW